LGGAPSVWSVAMVFFRRLLAGYATRLSRDASVAARRSCIRRLASGLTLPIARSGFERASHGSGMLAACRAHTVPSSRSRASAPLLQWFASAHRRITRTASCGRPNLGSFAALLSYPLASSRC